MIQSLHQTVAECPKLPCTHDTCSVLEHASALIAVYIGSLSTYSTDWRLQEVCEPNFGETENVTALSVFPPSRPTYITCQHLVWSKTSLEIISHQECSKVSPTDARVNTASSYQSVLNYRILTLCENIVVYRPCNCYNCVLYFNIHTGRKCVPLKVSFTSISPLLLKSSTQNLAKWFFLVILCRLCF